MKEFAKRLIELRTELNLTQQQLSQATQIPQQTISSWEVCSSIPKADSLVILSNFFKCSVDYLLGLVD